MNQSTKPGSADSRSTRSAIVSRRKPARPRSPIFCTHVIGARGSRRAMAAHVDAHGAEVAHQMRHPRVKANRAPHRRMNEDDGLGFAPGIGEVVEVIRDRKAVRRLERAQAHALPLCLSRKASRSCAQRSGTESVMLWGSPSYHTYSLCGTCVL